MIKWKWIIYIYIFFFYKGNIENILLIFIGLGDMNIDLCYGYDEVLLKKWFWLSVNIIYIIYGKISIKI